MMESASWETTKRLKSLSNNKVVRFEYDGIQVGRVSVRMSSFIVLKMASILLMIMMIMLSSSK